jgi:hypothetical protein
MRNGPLPEGKRTVKKGGTDLVGKRRVESSALMDRIDVFILDKPPTSTFRAPVTLLLRDPDQRFSVVALY